MAVETATRGGSGHRLMDPAAAARSRPPPVLRCLTWRPVEVSSKICGINCEKFSQSKVQRGHLYQNEPRARLNNKHESSSDMIQPTSSEVTSSQRCLDTFVIVTAHKQVCANQQTTGRNQTNPSTWSSFIKINPFPPLTSHPKNGGLCPLASSKNQPPQPSWIWRGCSPEHSRAPSKGVRTKCHTNVSTTFWIHQDERL